MKRGEDSFLGYRVVLVERSDRKSKDRIVQQRKEEEEEEGEENVEKMNSGSEVSAEKRSPRRAATEEKDAPIAPPSSSIRAPVSCSEEKENTTTSSVTKKTLPSSLEQQKEVKKRSEDGDKKTEATSSSSSSILNRVNRLLEMEKVECPELKRELFSKMEKPRKVTAKERLRVRKIISDILVKEHNHHIRYGSRPMDFYIYAPTSAEDQSSTDSKLLIARAMPALIEYLQDASRKHIVDKVRQRVDGELYDAIVYDIEYRMMRRSIRPPKATYVPSSESVRKWQENLQNTITTGRRKRKKVASFAKIQSLKFQSEERRRERERIARRKMKRETERVAKIQEKERRKREKEEKQRLKRIAEEKRRLARLQKQEEERMYRSAYTRAACEDLEAGGDDDFGDGEYEPSQHKRFGPKVYGRLDGANLAVALSKSRRQRTLSVSGALCQNATSSPSSSSSLASAGLKAAQSNPDLISVAHFLWSAALALRVDTESLRIDSLERGFAGSSAAEVDEIDVFDAIMTRLVCHPHALHAFDAPIAVNVGFSYAWWGPRFEKMLRGLLQRAREVRRVCRRRENELAILNKWRRSERAVVDKRKKIHEHEGNHQEKMNERRRLRKERRRLRKEKKRRRREEKSSEKKKLSFVKKKTTKLTGRDGKGRQRVGTARARKRLAKCGWTIVERAGAHYVYKAPVGGRRFTSHRAAMAFHKEYVLGEEKGEDCENDVSERHSSRTDDDSDTESSLSESSSDCETEKQSEKTASEVATTSAQMSTATTGSVATEGCGVKIDDASSTVAATATGATPRTDPVPTAKAVQYEKGTVAAAICETIKDGVESEPARTEGAENEVTSAEHKVGNEEEGGGDDDDDDDDYFFPAGAECAQNSLNAHREWVATRERFDGHVVRVLCKGGQYFDAVVVREMMPDFLFEVWYVSDQTTEELVHVGRISPLPDDKSSKIPRMLERSLADNQVLLQRRTWAQKNVKLLKMGKVRRKFRSALNAASDIRLFRFILTMLEADDLLEEKRYWDGLCESALGIAPAALDMYDVDNKEGDGPRPVFDFLAMSVDRRIAAVSAICYYRIDESNEMRKEVRRVMDYRHRTVSIGLDANQNMLWHFPFLRDGHTRIYASSSGAMSGGAAARGPETWTLLSKTKAELKRLVDNQRALLATDGVRSAGAKSTSGESLNKRSKTLVKFARSTRAVLKNILDNADDAEAAGLARDQRARESCVPCLRRDFRTSVARRLLERVSELEKHDFYVDPHGSEGEDGHSSKKTMCVLCHFDGFTNPPALTCSKARCGATYHVACMRGIKKTEEAEVDSASRNSASSTTPSCAPAEPDNVSDYDAKYDARAVSDSSMAWLCPRCRSSRKIHRMFRPKPVRKAKKRKMYQPTLPTVQGWRKSSRLRNKPKVSYREMEEDLSFETSEEEEEVQRKVSTTTTSLALAPTPASGPSREPIQKRARVLQKVATTEKSDDDEEDNVDVSEEEPFDDGDDWVPDDDEFASSASIQHRSSGRLASSSRRSSSRGTAAAASSFSSLSTSRRRTGGRSTISTRWGDFVTKGQYVGWKIARIFNGRPIEADVVGYMKPEDEDDPELWHIVHADGDEEDIEKHEVEEGVKMWHVHKESLEQNDTAAPAGAAAAIGNNIEDENAARGRRQRTRVRFVWNGRSEAVGPLSASVVW